MDANLTEARAHPSIYVGESARSLCERSTEHWGDALAGKDASHMVEHQTLAHGGSTDIRFKFRLVKSFKSSLDRQIAEAIRIQKRGGGVLNRKGEFNRCGLTRLVIDNKWEREKWEKAWEDKGEGEDPLCDLTESRKTKPGSLLSDRPVKRRRIASA